MPTFSGGLGRRTALVVVACIIATWPAFFAVVAVTVAPRSPVVVNGAPTVMDGAASPRQQTRSITLNAATAVALVPTAYDTPTSGFCIAASPTQSVYLVAEGATSTAQGTGPFCADAALCVAGAIVPVAGRAWAILDAGAPLAVSCSFVDDGVGFGGGPRGAAAGGGAPTDASYVVMGDDPDLPNDRILTNGSGISLTDNGPGLSVELANTRPGDLTAEYLLRVADLDLPQARTLTAGSGISLTDGGAGGALTIASTVSLATACLLSGGANCTMTGPVLGAAGSAAAPPFSFAADTDTGLFRSAANTLDMVAGGSSLTSLASSGFTVTPPILAVSSGTADPALVFSTDTDTGIFQPVAGTLGIQTDGTSRVQVSSSTTSSTGVFSGPTGAVGAPSFTFTGDTDTGVYRPSANICAVSAAGVLGLQVGNGTAATGTWVLGQNDSVNVGVFQLPRSVSTAPAQPSATLFCDVTRSGFTTYYDDTNDTVRGRVCVCTSDGGIPETYAWRDISDMTTACP